MTFRVSVPQWRVRVVVAAIRLARITRSPRLACFVAAWGADFVARGARITS